jgi:adenylosuccinate lyase
MAFERNLALPGNLRYQPKALQSIFGYDNLFFELGRVEFAVMQTLGEIGVIPASELALLTPELEREILAIRTTDVDVTERSVTKHDVRAWVRLAQEKLPSPLRRWLHIPLTSYDALDTARSLQFKNAFQHALRPSLGVVIRLLARLTEQHAEAVQIGRTHGQYALPITVGFWLAGILHRLTDNAERLSSNSNLLVGKISGAVGAYNAQVGLGIEAKCVQKRFDKHFEARVLEKLGLLPAEISSQILPPEPLANYLFSCTLISATLGQFGRDCRHLMRSEIGEVAEAFEDGQVGSSTMAHKRNPITFENLEGMWLRTKNEYGKVLDTLVSEHQRDLVGSSLARDYPIIVVNLMQQLETLLRKDKNGKAFLERLTFDSAACKRNFNVSADAILAEPWYIALQMAGYDGDAHDLINHYALKISRERRVSLMVALDIIARDDMDLEEAMDKIQPEIRNLLEDPASYTGRAAEKAREIAASAKSTVRDW